MQTVVGVRFKRAGKIYYFSPGKLDIKLNVEKFFLYFSVLCSFFSLDF